MRKGGSIVGTYRYRGRAYRQALADSAPWLLSFVAPADELSQWAGVPRRSEQNQAGFQRLEDQGRVDKAKEFFQQPVNQSPTSLILGLHGTLSSRIGAQLKFLEADADTGGSLPCELVIEYDAPSAEEARDIVREQLRQRLEVGNPLESGLIDNGGVVGTTDIGAAPGDTTERSEVTTTTALDTTDETIESDPEDVEYVEELDDTDDTDDGDDESELEQSDELELGQSVVEQLLSLLDDDDWLSSDDNAAAVIDLAKPATIIDGQHRLLGADATERAIPFSVVALADCPWPEQVFQFTVVNYTAKGIPDQFITANAALSLTKPELDSLKTRLIQANVKIKEYDLMRIVNFDARSPFSGLINLTEKANRSLIGYKTMVRIANQWFDAKHQYFNTLLPRLYQSIRGKGQKTKRREQWREGDWGEFFLAFWQEVHAKFRTAPSHEPGKVLWDVGHSQLTVAVVLLEMQSAFLDNLNAQDEDWFDVPEGEDPLEWLTAKVRLRATKFVDFFPPAFFSTKWGITSLNTGSGRKDLETCIRSMVDAKGKYQYASDRLVTGG